MAKVTGLTAERMLEIEAMSIVNGAVDLSTGVLTLQRHDGSTAVAVNVRGVGLQPGGTTGQAFFKKSNADYDAEWRDLTIDGSQVTSGKVPTSRLANHDADSSTGRVWQTTDPEGRWDSEDQTVLLLSPVTDSSHTNALTLSVDGSTVFGVSKTGVLTRGVIPRARLEPPILLEFSGSNLNSIISTGVWHQSSNAGASAGSNYPTNLAGLLEVFSYGGFVYQRYTTYGYRNVSTEQDPRSARVYTRALYNGGWSGWQAISRQGNASGRAVLNVSANTIASAYVAFPSGRFNTGMPVVTATVHSGSANSRSVSISDPTTEGVTIYLWSSNSVTNSVSWIAQEAG